jgi:hypothetical protein
MAAMGFSPGEVDQWEPFQVSAAQRGWILANTADAGPKPPSDAEYRAAIEREMRRSLH